MPTRLEELRELRRLVNYETASFDHIGPTERGDRLPATEAEVTDFIRRRTKIHRDSWINPIIDRLIDEAAARLKSSRDRRRRGDRS